MIRHDYLLQMIEEFARRLARITALRRGDRRDEADASVEEELDRLVGVDSDAILQLSETELFARILEGQSTLAVRDRALFLAALLKEAGDILADDDPTGKRQECYRKALNLLLDVLGRFEVVECPQFVPSIDALLGSLTPAALPVRTHVLLMQYFERTGAFARAEDSLFSILHEEPANAELLDFGRGFYRRLLAQSDHVLTAGNLPRAEVEAGQSEWEKRASERPGDLP